MIHNLRETEVLALVRTYLTPEVLTERGLPPGEATQWDVACRMLNRLAPRYVTSERGWNHHRASEGNDEADLVALLFESLGALNRQSQAVDKSGGHPMVYLLPVFFGRVKDGNNLLPVEGAQVTCFLDGKVLTSETRPFPNPYTTHRLTEGLYTFLPDPVPANSAADRTFLLKFQATLPGRTAWQVTHSITLSPRKSSESFTPERVHLPDAVL